MCGIAGKIYLGGGEVTEKNLKEMLDKIVHRGPDDWGIYTSQDNKIGLANRRLAIIDLTKAGHQPMNYRDRFWITYNGEVYNFLEQRQKLETQGYRFFSNTDTEVVLTLYDKYGKKCLEHLRGMFAFAIYDEKEKTLFLARDRIGEKPLKYYWNGHVFIFASELKAILTQKEVKRSIDWLAIHYYLTYGYVPSPQTGFENIYKLEPGHYILIDLKTKTINKVKYWQPDFTKKLLLSENEWCKEILKELEEATKLRMIADVPIGAFLSGGVDSSAVVATMARLSDKPIKTFTVGFKNKQNDERNYAENIVKLYNTDHETIIAQPEAIDDLLPQLVESFEEPFADSSAIITYMVCKMARKYVKVVLTGDGGDENFAGYDNRMQRLKRDVLLDHFQPFLRPIGLPLSSFLSKKMNIPIMVRANKFLEKSKTDIADRYVSYNQFFSNSEKRLLYLKKFNNINQNHNPYLIARKIFQKAKTPNIRDQALYFDLVNWLPESQLTKIDIASMAVSLEVRPPFLDLKIIELVAKIPFNLKVRGNEYKYILKKAVENIVPKENLYRKKVGFTIPLDKWFKGNLNRYSRSVLLSKNAKSKILFDSTEIKRMLTIHSKENDFGSKLWSLLTFENWLQAYFN